ncbi:MAG: pyridoxine 5'-phosphate synthase [Verrucomicrobiota bacterium]
MTILSVNLNKIALLRNSRGHDYPHVITMAERALQAGAEGVTIHPRPDQRHATYQDVIELKTWISDHPGKELNIEGYPSEKFMDVVIAAQPHQCTLVPDADNQLTSDHGWSLPEQTELLQPIISRLKEAGIRVSLFVDNDPQVATAAVETGTDRVELYTGPYAEAYTTDQQSAMTLSYAKTAQAAAASGLGINAGHDLDLKNLHYLISEIPAIAEVSIGHALTAEALNYGWDETIKRYVKILQQAQDQD